MRFPLRTLFCAICLAAWLSSFMPAHDPPAVDDALCETAASRAAG